MLFGLFFAFWRFMEIITLIPTMGILAYFVNIYASANALTPEYILILFIVSVLGCAWTIFTLFTYHRSKNNAQFVAIVDVLFVGALIGATHALRMIGAQDCTSVTPGAPLQIDLGILGSATLNAIVISANKQCALLKTCFALAIMNCFFFFFTSVIACLHGRGNEERREEVKETNYSRHGHRREGSHRSHRSHRSDYSSRRTPYV